MKDISKYAYYASFDTSKLLGAKEILKSMPALYNRVYFSTKYSNALWNGTNETFSNVTLLTENSNIEMLRQIIKNNFLYLANWDSKKVTDKADYGFSFIAGNVQFIVMPFLETQNGYIIRSYDVISGEYKETTIEDDKRYFLDVSMSDTGEFLRSCSFNLEDINESNTVIEKAPIKETTEMIMYNRNGSTILNMIVILLIGTLSFMAVYASYHLLLLGII